MLDKLIPIRFNVLYDTKDYQKNETEVYYPKIKPKPREKYHLEFLKIWKSYLVFRFQPF